MSSNFRNDGALTVVTLRNGGSGNRRFQDRRRHVSFMKPRKEQGKRRSGFHYRDDEGDITMSDVGPSHSRFNPYGGGRSRRRDNHPRNKPLAMDKEREDKLRAKDRLGDVIGKSKSYGKFQTWKKIIIFKGKELGEEFIVKNLQQLTSRLFCPFYFHFEDEHAIFYVDSREIANNIQSCNKRLTTPQGFKMSIAVSSSESPKVPLTDKVLDKVKVIMSKRYDVDTQTLDLKQFYADSDLLEEGLYISLRRDEVFSSIVRIIEQNIPQLVALDLGRNQLTTLRHLSTLPVKAPNLKKLDLSRNAINDVTDLSKINSFQLEDLVLQGNPLCDQFKTHDDYVRMIRQYFPRVIRLDGTEMPRPIVFDVETATPLPTTQRSFFINEQVQSVVIKFLEQYFMVYDSGDRQGLLEAYHDQALFSYSVFKVGPRVGSVVDLINRNRNLLRVEDFDKRLKLLHRGRLNVVSCLCHLPKSRHDPNSIVVDVTCASPALVNFSVSGIFKEETRSSEDIFRHFVRAVVAVPSGTSLIITNEQMFITSASVNQIQTAFKSAAPTPSSSPVPRVLPEIIPSSNFSPEQKQIMVANFAQQSGMNAEWSLKCLEENNWDYEKSAEVFVTLNNSNSIPAEAFLK